MGRQHIRANETKAESNNHQTGFKLSKCLEPLMLVGDFNDWALDQSTRLHRETVENGVVTSSIAIVLHKEGDVEEATAQWPESFVSLTFQAIGVTKKWDFRVHPRYKELKAKEWTKESILVPGDAGAVQGVLTEGGAAHGQNFHIVERLGTIVTVFMEFTPPPPDPPQLSKKELREALGYRHLDGTAREEEREERQGLACAGSNCRYLVHPKSKFAGGYCCHACAKNEYKDGEKHHGPQCRKLKAERKAPKADSTWIPDMIEGNDSPTVRLWYEVGYLAGKAGPAFKGHDRKAVNRFSIANALRLRNVDPVDLWRRITGSEAPMDLRPGPARIDGTPVRDGDFVRNFSDEDHFFRMAARRTPPFELEDQFDEKVEQVFAQDAYQLCNTEMIDGGVLCVSLAKCTERRAYTSRQMELWGFPAPRFIDATAPRDTEVLDWYNSSRIAKFPPCFRCGELFWCLCKNNVLITEQVANWLSFRKAWTEIAEGDHEWYLLVEDDVKFTYRASECWNALISQKLLDGLEDEPCMIRCGWQLGYAYIDGSPPELASGVVRMSNHCSILNRSMARVLLQGSSKLISCTSDTYGHEFVATNYNHFTMFPPISYDLSFCKKVPSLIRPKGAKDDDEANKADVRQRSMLNIKEIRCWAKTIVWCPGGIGPMMPLDMKKHLQTQGTVIIAKLWSELDGGVRKIDVEDILELSGIYMVYDTEKPPSWLYAGCRFYCGQDADCPRDYRPWRKDTTTPLDFLAPTAIDDVPAPPIPLARRTNVPKRKPAPTESVGFGFDSSSSDEEDEDAAMGARIAAADAHELASSAKAGSSEKSTTAEEATADQVPTLLPAQNHWITELLDE